MLLLPHALRILVVGPRVGVLNRGIEIRIVAWRCNGHCGLPDIKESIVCLCFLMDIAIE